MVKLNCTKLNFAIKNDKYFSAARNIGWRHYVTISHYVTGFFWRIVTCTRQVLYYIFKLSYYIFKI